MIGLAIGMLMGLGLFLVWWSCWPPDPETDRPSPRSGPVHRLRDDLVQAGYPSVSVGVLGACSALLGVGVGVVLVALTGVRSIAVCFAIAALTGPTAMVRLRARRRRVALRDVWPDAIDNIASGVRAGLALPEALAQLAVRGPEELRPAFQAFAHDYRTTGRFQDSLDRLKDSLSDPVGDRLVESLRIAREVGGSDLGRLLRTLSSFLREDAHTRAELETRQSWTVNAARLAVAAPWIVLGMLCTRPESLRAYDTRTGALVLLMGAVVTVVAYQVMLRIGRLPEDQRVLR